MDRESTPRILVERAPIETPPATARSHELRPVSSGVGSLFDSRRAWRPTTASMSKTSLQLVEQTKMDDPEKFKIWEVGGRANTPNSFWREQRQYEAAATQGPVAATRGMPWTNLSHTRVRAMQEKGHMRALLLGSARREAKAEGPRDLNGHWISVDGEMRGQVEGNIFYWDCDGSRSRVRLGGEREEIVSIAVDGCRHFGALSEDGRRLFWADGDIWVRHDEEAQTLAKVVKDQCGDHELQPQIQIPSCLCQQRGIYAIAVMRLQDSSQPVGLELGVRKCDSNSSFVAAPQSHSKSTPYSRSAQAKL